VNGKTGQAAVTVIRLKFAQEYASLASAEEQIALVMTYKLDPASPTNAVSLLIN